MYANLACPFREAGMIPVLGLTVTGTGFESGIRAVDLIVMYDRGSRPCLVLLRPKLVPLQTLVHALTGQTAIGQGRSGPYRTGVCSDRPYQGPD